MNNGALATELRRGMKYGPFAVLRSCHNLKRLSTRRDEQCQDDLLRLRHGSSNVFDKEELALSPCLHSMSVQRQR